MFEWLQILYYYYIRSFFSKWIGRLAHVYIPSFLRGPIIRWYAWKTNSRLYEVVKPVNEFENIFQFFTREIKPRPIDATNVAPVDCTILSAGKLVNTNFRIEQVKGISYKLEEVLAKEAHELDDIKHDKLYFMSIHLPASECHRFRSPADWVVEKRTHVPGFMYRLHQEGMFKTHGAIMNERVVLEGKWTHGRFFFVPIAAAKVGEIVINFDKQLKTNVIGEAFRKEEKNESFRTTHFFGITTNVRDKIFKDEVHLKKGEEFGHFQGGSAFIVVFEHDDENFQFLVDPPQYVLYGNPLSNL